jgi:hypothetical protein
MPTVTLRPNSDYNTQISFQYPNDGQLHYQKVDDETPDDNGTYVYMTTDVIGTWTDLYGVPAIISPDVYISSVQVTIRGDGDIRDVKEAAIALYTHGGTYTYPILQYIDGWHNTSVTLTTNPATDKPWTPSEVNLMKIGVQLRHLRSGYVDTIRCTQVYAVVTYINKPTVTTSSATNIEETTATLGGDITDTGGQNCDQRGVEYGTQSGVYPYESVESGSFGTGAYTRNITGLSPGTRYYFRAKAHNVIGWGYGSELQFLTKPLAPTNLTVTDYSGDSISLSWTKGTGANRTMIRRKQGSYPTSITDGTQVYFDTGTSVTDSGLEPRQTYYYRAWSEVSADSLQQWSDDYAQVYQTTPLYYTTGWIGDVIDCGSTVRSYDRLEWDATIPTANESIMVQIRSSIDQVNWSNWQYVYSSPCTSFTIPVRRYLEWRARLSGNSYRTPVLHNLNFFWSRTS